MWRNATTHSLLLSEITIGDVYCPLPKSVGSEKLPFYEELRMSVSVPHSTLRFLAVPRSVSGAHSCLLVPRLCPAPEEAARLTVPPRLPPRWDSTVSLVALRPANRALCRSRFLPRLARAVCPGRGLWVEPEPRRHLCQGCWET